MRKNPCLHIALLIISSLSIQAYADETTQSIPPVTTEAPKVTPPPPTPFKAFTGKITKNKVRLRTQPNLDAPIIREVCRDNLYLIIGESGDFFAVQPPKETKAYIFRTFVLDNVVEGSRVNIRLEPDLEAPVIAQLNTGDRIQGIVSAQNNKWLEIDPPASTRFYIAKEFVQNIGDAEMLARLEKRGDDVNQLLAAAAERSQTELQKAYDEIHLESVYEALNQVIQKYSDFPQQVAQAKELLKTVQETQLQKKIAYLELRTKASADSLSASNQMLKDEIKTQQDRLSLLEEQLTKQAEAVKAAAAANAARVITPIEQAPITAKMSGWLEAEEGLYAEWNSLHQDVSNTMVDFYQSQLESTVCLKGVLEPYEKPVKNKPGDYVLVNRYNNLPMAYLYSTQVNLQDYVGHEVTVSGLPRPNNNFAFPAYFVVTLQ